MLAPKPPYEAGSPTQGSLMARSTTRLQIDIPPMYPAYVPEPDVWWGEDGIDAWLGAEPICYEPPSPVGSQTTGQDKP